MATKEKGARKGGDKKDAAPKVDPLRRTLQWARAEGLVRA